MYIAASTNAAGNSESPEKSLAEALRRFCRSIELCDDYLRGYYGLKLVYMRFPIRHTFLLTNSQTSSRLLSSPTARQSRSDDGPSPPDVKTLQRLNETATAKLTEIVRRGVAGEPGWRGYDAAELIAARELLDRDRIPVTH